MRRFPPANVEQFLQEHGVVLGRPQQQLAVARMYGRLLTREKSGANPCARRAECEHSREPATVNLHLAQAKCRLFPDRDPLSIYEEYGISEEGYG